MNDDENLLVSGKIIFEENVGTFYNATVYVSLLDTGKQDAASTIISKQIIDNVSIGQDNKPEIEFLLKGEIDRSQFTTYTISVLVDVDGDGEISLGDYITMENYEVLKDNIPDRVTVKVKRVS